jgi:hypothetical protein
VTGKKHRFKESDALFFIWGSAAYQGEIKRAINFDLSHNSLQINAKSPPPRRTVIAQKVHRAGAFLLMPVDGFKNFAVQAQFVR